MPTKEEKVGEDQIKKTKDKKGGHRDKAKGRGMCKGEDRKPPKRGVRGAAGSKHGISKISN